MWRVDKEQLDPVAALLRSAYFDTGMYSRRFLDDYGTPPSLMAKVHHLLSVVQVGMANDDRYKLSSGYAEYGRVRFAERSTGSEFLLRSSAAVLLEKAKEGVQLALFETATLFRPDEQVGRPGVRLLIHKFIPTGLKLWVSGTTQKNGRKRLLAVGTPTFVGFWPFMSEKEPPPFDQKEADPFSDVGDLDYDDGEEGQAE